ncbi:MAG: LuxR C-terminal-related transcriptional regulator, partial [Burkholderiales bacterium]
MNPNPALVHDAEGPLPAALLRQLVDALDFGAMLLEPCGRIRWANRPARQALSLGDVLGVTEGRLSMHGPQQQRALVRALAEAAGGGVRMLCLGGGVPSTKLGLAPWGVDEDGTPLLLGTLQTGEREQWPALRAYARERRLTEGETDVLQQLVLGDRPPQIAARRGSSEGTVRSQIKTLLEKTGTHSMRELVVEALHLPPMPAGVRPLPAAPRAGGMPPHLVPPMPAPAGVRAG